MFQLQKLIVLNGLPSRQQAAVAVAPPSSFGRRDNDLDSPLPYFKVPSLLRPKWVSLEMIDDDSQVVNGVRCKHNLRIRVSEPFLVMIVAAGNPSSLPVRLNHQENVSIIGAEVYSETRLAATINPATFLAPPIAKPERSLSVRETRNPMAECNTVYVGRERSDRVGASHDSLLESGLWLEVPRGLNHRRHFDFNILRAVGLSRCRHSGDFIIQRGVL